MYFRPPSLDLALLLGVGGQHVEAEAQQLQGDVGGQQFPRLGHHVHAQYREEHDSVVLALVLQVFVHEVHGTQDDEHPDAHEQHLEPEGEGVHRQQAVVQTLVHAPQHED